MKKILLLTYYWPPAGGAGVQRWLKFSKYLSRHGYDVTVITVDPGKANYPQKDFSLEKDLPDNVKVIRTDTSEPFTAYKKVTASKETPFGGFSNQRKKNIKEEIAKFIRGNFFLPDARKGWNKFAIEEARKIIRSENTDILITTSPPHSTQLIGKALKKEFPKLQWIADLRDPWTSIYYYKDLYPTFPAKLYDKIMEKTVIRQADHVITVSRNIAREFANHVNNQDKVVVIPNGYDHEDFLHEIPEDRTFTITYTGTISHRYPIKSFLAAAKKVSESAGKIRLRFVGTVPSGIEDEIIKGGVGDVEFTGQVEHLEAIRYMKRSSLLLLLIPDTPGNKGILTGKLFEYIGSKTPILCLGPEDGEASAIIRDSGSGQTFSPDRINDIAGYINDIIKNPKPSTNSLSTKYSRENLTTELEKLF